MKEIRAANRQVERLGDEEEASEDERETDGPCD
jgi:hypothetical protein